VLSFFSLSRCATANWPAFTFIPFPFSVGQAEH
jgi:hypothetical protein